MIGIYKIGEASQIRLDQLKRRAQTDVESSEATVSDIVSRVRREGDKALVEYNRKWDDPDFDSSKLRVTKGDIEEAYAKTDETVLESIKKQIRLSSKFHIRQRESIKDWEEEIEPGIVVGEKWTPIEEVGLYVPGGKNPFPTVQQILAVPAKLAGCKRIVSCISPKGDNHEVIIAANECGIQELYRVSGVHAIAAMAYGTESIQPVQLIAGPGGPYVTAAKILCQRRTAIDVPAGPSEAIILADGKTIEGVNLAMKASYCAADILARAEHGPDSAGVLVTCSHELAELTKEEVVRQFTSLTRKDIIQKALGTYCAIIVTRDMEEAIRFTNDYAPEHLEILTENPRSIFMRIANAGSVFLGFYNPVAAGDYATGVNHILPTGTWANRSSPVGVWTFMKRVQFSQVSRTGLLSLQPIVDTIAEVEGLDAHRKSVDTRL